MRPSLDIRQYTDTRAGVVLILLAVLSTIAITAAVGIAQPMLVDELPALMSASIFGALLPLSIALPVLGVTIVAGEWSNSSIQTTFLHRPQRGSVLLSKVIAALVIGTIVVAIGVATAWGSTMVGAAITDKPAEILAFADLIPQVLVIYSGLLFGIAMGTLLQNTPLALVASLAVPMVVMIVGGLVTAFAPEIVARLFSLIDLTAAAAALGRWELRPEHVGSFALLLVLPLAAGAMRWRHREIG